jgi:hypothetical protein
MWRAAEVLAGALCLVGVVEGPPHVIQGVAWVLLLLLLWVLLPLLMPVH